MSFMFRPRALLPTPIDSPTRVGKCLGMLMGIWIGDELALLGAHFGWKLVLGILRISLGDIAPISGARSLFIVAIRTFLNGSLASLGFTRWGAQRGNRKTCDF